MSGKRVSIDKRTLDIVLRTELSDSERADFAKLSSKKDEKKTTFKKDTNLLSGQQGLRIIGVVRNMDMTVAGYVLYNDNNNTHRIYSTDQVLYMLSMYSMVNAKINNNKVMITDASEDSLFQFDTNGKSLAPSSLYILSRNTDTFSAGVQSKTKQSFTALTDSLQVIRLPLEELKNMVNRGLYRLCNMKLVHNENGENFLAAKDLDALPTFNSTVEAVGREKTEDARSFGKQQKILRSHAAFTQRVLDILNNAILLNLYNKPLAFTNGLSKLKIACNSLSQEKLDIIMQQEVLVLYGLNPTQIAKAKAKVDKNSFTKEKAKQVFKSLNANQDLAGILNTNLGVRLLAWIYAALLLKVTPVTIDNIIEYRYKTMCANKGSEPDFGYYIGTIGCHSNWEEYLRYTKYRYNAAENKNVIDASRLFNGIHADIDKPIEKLTDIIGCDYIRIPPNNYNGNSRIVLWPSLTAVNKDTSQLSDVLPYIKHIATECIRATTDSNNYNKEYCIDRAVVMWIALGLYMYYNNTSNLMLTAEAVLKDYCSPKAEVPNKLLTCTATLADKSVMRGLVYSTPTDIMIILKTFIMNGGLLVPYHGTKKELYRDPSKLKNMHWECIFPTLKNTRLVKNTVRSLGPIPDTSQSYAPVANSLREIYWHIFHKDLIYNWAHSPNATQSRNSQAEKGQLEDTDIANYMQFLFRPARTWNEKYGVRTLRITAPYLISPYNSYSLF